MSDQCVPGPGDPTLGAVPLDPWLVTRLDAFRAEKYLLARYVEQRNDEAFMHDLAAGVCRRLATYATKQANEDLPPVPPDQPTGLGR